MPDTAAIDHKIKRFSAIEADYHHRIKRAKEDIHRDPDRKRKYERVIAKYERKIEKLLPKIRRARELRHARKDS